MCLNLLIHCQRNQSTDSFEGSYLQEGQVAVSINAGNLQIAHDNFTVFVELLQGAVLLVQIRQSAQLVLCARAN